jgi:hypothetical protein
MASRISFQIAFEGSAQCWKDANVCAIDLLGPKSEVSAQSVGKKDSSLRAGPLQWHVTNKGEFPGEKVLDEISLASAVAKTITLIARVFESYESEPVQGLDGIKHTKQWEKYYNIEIGIEDHAELEDGKRYLIKVQTVGERRFKAEFIKLDEQEPRTSKVKVSNTAEKPSQDQVIPFLLDRLHPSLKSTKAFSDWSSMVETFKHSHQVGDDELDPLSTVELQGRFNAGMSRLNEARQRFTKAATVQGDTEGAAEHMKSCICTLLKLEAALNRKGVYLP